MDAAVSRRQSIRGRGLSDSINYAGQGRVRARNTCQRKKRKLYENRRRVRWASVRGRTTIAISAEKRYDKLAFQLAINFGGVLTYIRPNMKRKVFVKSYLNFKP